MSFPINNFTLFSIFYSHIRNLIMPLSLIILETDIARQSFILEFKG